MKLIEIPVKNPMQHTFPNIQKYVFGDKPVQLYRLFSIDKTYVILGETETKTELILINTHRKVRHGEIDLAIKNIFEATRAEVDVNIYVRRDMLEAGWSFKYPYKDVILVTKEK